MQIASVIAVERISICGIGSFARFFGGTSFGLQGTDPGTRDYSPDEIVDRRQYGAIGTRSVSAKTSPYHFT